MASSFLSEELGVAQSGVYWNLKDFKVWGSTQPNVLLFSPRQPVLAKDLQTGRYQVALSQYREQKPDGSYAISSGSAIFTITSAIEFDPQAFAELKQQWLTEMAALGPEPPANPRFVPLNVQKGEAQVLINPRSGVPNQAHNDHDTGTPGGMNSFLVELTDLGAQEWAEAIQGHKAIPAGVKMTYEYLRMMPDVGAEVIVHGSRVFNHLSGALDVSYDGILYGGSAKLEAAWENMVRDGAIEIVFIGGDLPPDLEKQRQDLTSSFAAQAREALFKSLFEPKPDVKPAEAGDSGGFFGGANFAFKWKSDNEAIDLRQTIRFKGMTWLKASSDADLATLFAVLDDSYVNKVQKELAFTSSLVVDDDPQLESVALSVNYSEGRAPETPVYGHGGGTAQFVVASAHPGDVKINYTAKINYKPAEWPVISAAGSSTVAEGGNQIVIKPSSWIGRNTIYMLVRDGDQIVLGDTGDYLIANVSYTGPHLPAPIKGAARITSDTPLEFAYPLSPAGERGEARFSAFGVIGGKLVRSQGDQLINVKDEAVFILASKDGIQLVSQDSVLAEDDNLAAELLGAQGRPVISGAGGPTEETQPSGEPAADGRVLSGVVVAVEYGARGPALVVETATGARRHVPLLGNGAAFRLADAFDESRKRVKIRLDEQDRAQDILVELPA
jgi:hypothetical protein